MIWIRKRRRFRFAYAVALAAMLFMGWAVTCRSVQHCMKCGEPLAHGEHHPFDDRPCRPWIAYPLY